MRTPILTEPVRPGHVLLILAAVFLACSGSGGSTTTLGLPEDSYTVTASAEPLLICPLDPVDVSWEVGTAGGYPLCTEADAEARDCLLPLAVFVDSAPDLFAAMPVGRSEVRGTRTVHPPSNTTIRVIGGRTVGEDWYSTTREFGIGALEDELELPALAEGDCVDGRPFFRGLQVDGGTRLGESVVFNRMHLRAGSPYPTVLVEVYHSGSPAPETFLIGRGDWVDVPPPPLGFRMTGVIVRPEPFAFMPPVDCPEGGMLEGGRPERPPDDIPLLVSLTCSAGP